MAEPMNQGATTNAGRLRSLKAGMGLPRHDSARAEKTSSFPREGRIIRYALLRALQLTDTSSRRGFPRGSKVVKSSSSGARPPPGSGDKAHVQYCARSVG